VTKRSQRSQAGRPFLLLPCSSAERCSKPGAPAGSGGGRGAPVGSLEARPQAYLDVLDTLPQDGWGRWMEARFPPSRSTPESAVQRETEGCSVSREHAEGRLAPVRPGVHGGDRHHGHLRDTDLPGVQPTGRSGIVHSGLRVIRFRERMLPARDRTGPRGRGGIPSGVHREHHRGAGQAGSSFVIELLSRSMWASLKARCRCGPKNGLTLV
jgi:hypothetical protein